MPLLQVAQRRRPDRIVVTPYALSTYEDVRPAVIHDKFTSIGARRPQLQALGGRAVDNPPGEALRLEP